MALCLPSARLALETDRGEQANSSVKPGAR